MLPCQACAYRKSIPGNCHISCNFNWSANVEKLHQTFGEHTVSDRATQWFRFPYNFDPVWGPDVCAAQSEVQIPEDTKEFSALEELLILFG
jgi:hypothetical protein